LPQRTAKLSVDGDFGCVKFISKWLEYDFSIAATKAMFSNFERNNATDVILQILHML
jgi:hypothetical protein